MRVRDAAEALLTAVLDYVVCTVLALLPFHSTFYLTVVYFFMRDSRMLHAS